MKPYKNLNGDSLKTILQDYNDVIGALDGAITAISRASSLSHGRNAMSDKHAAALREQLIDNITTLRSIKDQYEKDLEELDEPFNWDVV